MIDAIRERLDRVSSPVVAVDAVKLIESGMTSLCDAVWLVTCEPEQQITRLMARSGLPRAEAERRVDAQPPVEPKRSMVDTVIDNSGSIAETCRQVDRGARKAFDLTAAGKTVTYERNSIRRDQRRRGVSETIKVEIFYDYGCPYVHAAAVWIDSVKAALGDRLQVTWRYFPLEQVNSVEGPEWKLWEQPADYKSRGRGAFHGAIAARNQGDDAFERFHLALLKAKHVEGKEHSQPRDAA